MRSYRVQQEVDWRWLLRFLEIEMDQRLLHYPRRKKGDSVEMRQAYMNNLLSLYISLRVFLKLSPLTKKRKKVEEFIKNGPGNRW